MTEYVKKGDKLYADANYSVNHGRNGKFLPYASDLVEWKEGNDKQLVAERLMGIAGMQLHQGRHSHQSYGGGKVGYKKRVEELLCDIRTKEAEHVTACQACKDASQDEKLPPRKNMTRKLDNVSNRLEKEMVRGDVFVSMRGYIWWSKS